ncbi:acyltransferase family protein [Kribbella sp. NBC_01245]|uniref:acyltransferase family protein n=1 Tax=Kribbella sp. NBC_01245 TaxID=2903578 RepID=UPI002E2965A5|nr:acyltransferase family protein [Kribbella sp. NBC_01245]
MSERRVAWADVAKGVCILLVVLWHVIMKHYLQIDWRISTPVPGVWGKVSEQLLPLRMPLFFTISGLFAVNAVRRPWPVLARTRVAKFAYLYALWLVIHTAVLAFVPDFGTERATNALQFLAQLTITPSNLWYLYALAVYFVIAKLVRDLPPALVLAAAFALSAITAAGLLDTPGNRGGVYQNLVFFLGGMYGKSVVERLAAKASWARLVAIGVPYAFLLGLIAVFDAKTWFGIWPLAGVVAVALGVTAAGLITRWAALTRGLAKLGGKTLPIYVLHMPLLALTHAVLIGPLSSVGPGVQWAVAVFEPVVLTAFLVWLCTWLRRFLPRALFDLTAPTAMSREGRPAAVRSR